MGAAQLWDGAIVPLAGDMPRRPHLRLVPTGAAVRPQRVAPARLRATARGRLVAVIAGAALAIAIVSIVVSGWFAAAPSAAPTVTVQPGQTLSQIAAEQFPDLPVAAGVLSLQQANGLSSDQVSAGQTLVVSAP